MKHDCIMNGVTDHIHHCWVLREYNAWEKLGRIFFDKDELASLIILLI